MPHTNKQVLQVANPQKDWCISLLLLLRGLVKFPLELSGVGRLEDHDSGLQSSS